MKKIIVLMTMIIIFMETFSDSIPMIPILPAIKNEEIDEIPTVPALPQEDLVEVAGIRPLEQNTTVMMNLKLDVVVPLEIISDVDIYGMVIDNQKLEIPFDVELNKVPDKKDYYSIKFSETEIDIDNDGQIDTKIYTPKFINTRIVEDNILYVDGAKISKEGTHTKKVYMTIEVKE
ncbi:hypothetical protein [Fusobacterium sp. HC1336]|uniref:hypothetical protein n=1 Tax=Fusobacterium sp. HC1336 TaxID=3171169 RepID=UPI003F23C9A4